MCHAAPGVGGWEFKAIDYVESSSRNEGTFRFEFVESDDWMWIYRALPTSCSMPTICLSPRADTFGGAGARASLLPLALDDWVFRLPAVIPDISPGVR
jgi:hypothetical protein